MIPNLMAATIAWLRDCGARVNPENTPAELWIDLVHDAVAEELAE